MNFVLVEINLVLMLLSEWSFDFLAYGEFIVLKFGNGGVLGWKQWL